MIKAHRFLFYLMPAIGLTVALIAGAPVPGHAQGDVRDPILAGSWYPAAPAELTAAVTGYLTNAGPVEATGRPVGLIVPHAGYRYSGPVAGHAYRVIKGRDYDTVVVIAPSHHLRFDGVSVYNGAAYRTPLGDVPIDRNLVEALREDLNRVRYRAEAHAREHSLEIQLPFLQTALADFRLVPLVMGSDDLATCRWLADRLAEVLKDRSALLIASTDLSHFQDDKTARRLDGVVREQVAAFDPINLHQRLREGACEACGGGPMVTVMLAARALGADKGVFLNYATSGDVTGERRRVVGYLAAALMATDAGASGNPPDADGPGKPVGSLSDADRAASLRIARSSIRAEMDGEPVPDLTADANSPALEQPSGAFVTLDINGRLRECIGHIVGRLPLAETVSRMATAAAFEDPRFPPLKPDELDRVTIEISVLGPLTPVTEPDDIRVGTHGLYIQRGGRSGLLLPQVATDHGWDRDEFLAATCRKAGLPSDAWRDPETRLQTFTAEVFSEPGGSS